MENLPFISLTGYNRHFESPERRERYFKWSESVYIPFRMKNPGLLEYSRYQMMKGNPDYPEGITIQHFTNQSSYDFRVKNQENVDVTRDMRTSWGTEWIWIGLYRLVKSARRDIALPGKTRTTTQIVNAPLLHIEALDLNSAGYDRYAAWLNNVGTDIFTPLLMETTKLMGWDLFEWTGVVDDANMDMLKIKKYPKYLSLLYFPSVEDFHDFEKSPALAAFKRAVKQVLSDDIVYKWYVEYQLWNINRREV